MPDRDRSAHHVEPRAIHFADRLGEARALGPLLRLEASEVREHLRGERLVHLDEVDVAQREPARVERDRRREHGRLQELLAGIERGVRVASGCKPSGV